MLLRVVLLCHAVGTTDALRLPTTAVSRRQAAACVSLALAPNPASAKMLKKPPKDSAEKAKAYRLSAPKYGVDEGSDAFLANARRRRAERHRTEHILKQISILQDTGRQRVAGRRERPRFATSIRHGFYV